MRCKKHPCDHSSGVGVCASCLRERLFALIAAQAQAQQAHAQAQLSRALSRAADQNPHPNPNPPRLPPQPPPPAFPRSVSPYVSRRKSDGSAAAAAAAAAAAWSHLPAEDHGRRRNHHHLRFYSTPQVGPTYDPSSAADPLPLPYRKKKSRFSLLSSLFRSRSEKFNDPSARASCRDTSCAASSSSSSPSWFSAIFATASHRRSQFPAEDSAPAAAGARRSRARPSDRGMSPEFEYEWEERDGERSPSGSGGSSESSPRWKRTPSSAAPASSRRARPGQGRNVASGLAFCLSPLVRASPNRHWMGQKGLPPDIGGKPGDGARVSGKPQLSNAASFCKNRSRKLVDFGRANVNR